MKLVWSYALGCLFLFLAGCGLSETPRVQLKGKVAYEGQPVVFGTATFLPDRARGNHGAYGVAVVKDGFYQTNPGYGATLGPMIMSFQIFDDAPPNGKMIANIQRLPIDIPSGTTTRDFELVEKMMETNQRPPTTE